jgi:hypothetical protein
MHKHAMSTRGREWDGMGYKWLQTQFKKLILTFRVCVYTPEKKMLEATRCPVTFHASNTVSIAHDITKLHLVINVSFKSNKKFEANRNQCTADCC